MSLTQFDVLVLDQRSDLSRLVFKFFHQTDGEEQTVIGLHKRTMNLVKRSVSNDKCTMKYSLFISASASTCED